MGSSNDKKKGGKKSPPEKLSHEEYLAELTKPYRFKPGECGKHRAKVKRSQNLSITLKNQLDEPCVASEKMREMAEAMGLDPELTTIGAVLALRLIYKACDGDVAALREVFNRTEGKVPESTNLNLNSDFEDLLKLAVNIYAPTRLGKSGRPAPEPE